MTKTKIESQDLTGIDVTTSPAMKYLLVEIHERNSGKEHTARCLAQYSSNQDPMFVADAIALNWYEDYLDDAPNNDGLITFEDGAITVEVDKIHELSQEHYDLFSLYLSDLTPSDSAIAEAIEYRTAAKS